MFTFSFFVNLIMHPIYTSLVKSESFVLYRTVNLNCPDPCSPRQSLAREIVLSDISYSLSFLFPLLWMKYAGVWLDRVTFLFCNLICFCSYVSYQLMPIVDFWENLSTKSKWILLALATWFTSLSHSDPVQVNCWKLEFDLISFKWLLRHGTNASSNACYLQKLPQRP